MTGAAVSAFSALVWIGEGTWMQPSGSSNVMSLMVRDYIFSIL
jgi:hypothetical protein